MKCEFSVGDEVTRISDGVFVSHLTGQEVDGPTFGKTYTVSRVFIAQGEPAIELEEFALPWEGGWRASRFRPVAKRSDTLSIESFLIIKPGFEEPRRVVEPVKKGVGA